MEIDVLTLFPNIFTSPLQESILRIAQERGKVTIRIHDLRQFATDRHRVTDEPPYGGGPGMILKPEPLMRGVEALQRQGIPAKVILLTPQGTLFTQDKAQELAREKRLLLLCGRYGGVDERVVQCCVDEELSIGDYVLTGGELPALVVIDAVVRLLPGVVGNEDSLRQDSFAQGLLDAPQYTRPAEYRGYRVPDILLSGNHQAIAAWRRREALKKTWQRRPELLSRARLSEEDRRFLRTLAWQQGAETQDASSGQKPSQESYAIREKERVSS
ncbi:MAG: tRNA (guanosine(37)-N1)-methyltransferase TrmD [Nitrospinota bacterium]|nr:MAG: tRNA (guanosine(37)-N1)-methyltransferase TrmD [Nitrospinota bacterium]